MIKIYEKVRQSIECSYNGQELRCKCGNLVAKATHRGIELKCKRCKRIHIIPLITGSYRK